MSRIALVKPDKARSVEDVVLGMARRGQLANKAGVVGVGLEAGGAGARGGAATGRRGAAGMPPRRS